MDKTIVSKKFVQRGDGAEIRRTIKFENELDKDFAKKIADIAHGEAMYNCIQCGTCSATCPVSHYMDFTPRKIIAMVREGFKDEVLSSSTVWMCASCYSCTVECPKEIKITDVMYALKREAIAGGYYPKHFPTPALATSFFDQVKKNGRSSEGPLLVKVFLKTNPFKMFGNALLGWKLWKTGRMSMKSEKIKDRKGFAKLLNGLEKVKEVAVK
jgi:quinone-modifying oxidoreductase subunit QmoC